jgi:hypothetical protein
MRLVMLTTFAAIACLLSMSCGGNQQHAIPPGESQARYEELASRFADAMFQITYAYDEHVRARRSSLTWTKVPGAQRVDVVSEHEDGAVSGLTEVSQPEAVMSCIWASDDSRQVIDASCDWRGTGSRLLQRTLLEFFLPYVAASYQGSRSIAGREVECFNASILEDYLGLVCLSADGEPLAFEAHDLNLRIAALAVRIDPAEGVSLESILTPIIPSLVLGAEVSVKQASPDTLALPPSDIIDELFR